MNLDKSLKEFGNAVKSARLARELSQVKAAEQIKIDYRHYQNIEGGKINIRLDMMLRIADFYEMKLKVSSGNILCS